MKKFDKDLAHLTTALDRWTTFLSKAEQWERNFIPQELRTDPAITKAAQALDTLSLDAEEREIYEAQLKWLRTQAGALEKVREDSREEGREEGKEEGEDIGIRKVALRLLNLREFSIDKISLMTGLTKEELLALQNTIEDNRSI